MAKIFIIEDDENIRGLVVYALKSNGFEAFGFENGSGFFTELRKQTPDLILLDIMLPGEDGISILKKLKLNDNTQKTPVIMLTAKTSEYDKVTGLDLGADDYITKPFSVLELLSRVKAVLRRSPKIPVICGAIVLEGIIMDIDKHTVRVDGEAVTLTYKEFELLKYLMQNKGIVLSRDKIMERIWDFEFSGGSRTVDVHIKTLRQKLGSCGNLIETVRGIGYKVGK
ncbi:MAG: response regulator transcription factor [Clostridiales bacterium]|jgi:two-component system alkaline phosphatase synthesis response regulator PhoP|nr:response regulator transcription factor [Clostridiales bacterium]